MVYWVAPMAGGWLDITEEGWGDSQPLTDMTPPMAFLHFLTYLHGELTTVLLEKL